MKALEKDRNRRYESASAFAADLDRHLNREAVLACPPTAAYRLSKFARRNKAMLIGASLVLTASLVGAATATWQAMRANAAEQQSREKQRESELNFAAAIDAIEKLLSHVADPQLDEIPEFQQFRENVLKESLEFYERFTLERGSLPRLQFRAANVFRTLGELVRDNRNPDLYPLGAIAYAKGLALADHLVEEAPGKEEYRTLQAELYLNTGRFYMNRDVAKGSDEQAIKHLAHAETLYGQLAVIQPESKHFLTQQGDALSGLANIYLRRGSSSLPQALEYARRAYDLTERSIPSASAARTIATILQKSQPDQAEQFYRRCGRNRPSRDDE